MHLRQIVLSPLFKNSNLLLSVYPARQDMNLFRFCGVFWLFNCIFVNATLIWLCLDLFISATIPWAPHTLAENVVSPPVTALIEFSVRFQFHPIFPCLSFPCAQLLQSCPTLCNPWTIARQAPLSMGLSTQECWSEFPFTSSLPRDQTWVSCLGTQILYYWGTLEATFWVLTSSTVLSTYHFSFCFQTYRVHCNLPSAVVSPC